MNRHFSSLIPEKGICSLPNVKTFQSLFRSEPSSEEKSGDIVHHTWMCLDRSCNVTLKKKGLKKPYISFEFVLTGALQAAIVVTFLTVTVALSVLGLVYRKELKGIINAATLIQTRNTNLYPLCRTLFA